MPVKEAEHWNEISSGWSLKGYSNELLAEHKRKTHLGLIARWADVTNSHRILKTDLFAEAFAQEQFLFDIAKTNSNVVAMDISREIVALAKRQARQHNVDASRYICCDVRHLPIQSNSIDLIISDS
ncbi:class I SAM-dependent methyltransferase, partial [bacterium]|nr:class I SAM-dependent methyltransferase [bacterium]